MATALHKYATGGTMPLQALAIMARGAHVMMAGFLASCRAFSL